jgi:hypothetical protein
MVLLPTTALSPDPIGQLAVLVAIHEVIAGYRATSC